MEQNCARSEHISFKLSMDCIYIICKEYNKSLKLSQNTDHQFLNGFITVTQINKTKLLKRWQNDS